MPPLVEKARAYLDARGAERVTLAELARAVGASPFHLQRRFKRALGVSPQAYQDARRVEAIKSGLRNGARVTDAVFDAGYGSLSRFYEKAGTRLGMGAREYRARGKGLRIAYSIFTLPIGRILLAATPRGVCAVKLGDDAAALRRLLADEFANADLIEDGSALREIKDKVVKSLQGDGSISRIPLDLRGTVFQRRVWDELRRIPRGETRTYADIARRIGSPRAVRAVGGACGANPVALVVPCHRVVRADGGLGGYGWGIGRKAKLLEIERQAKK
ncbi:MAG: bifunctional transcriptional activator/DNA repair enzyme AdaA [Burkholderiales bacterium]